MYPTEVEVRFENRQVEDCLLDDSMEQDEGSEEIVRSSTNSPPFRGWNGDPRSLPSREPGIGGYQALGPRAPLGGSLLDLLSPLPRVSLPLLGGTVLLTLLGLIVRSVR